MQRDADRLRQMTEVGNDSRPSSRIDCVIGEIGLLRSLAIAPPQRGGRLGKAMLAHAEREAARLGVRELWLLTSDADRYFRRNGYAAMKRECAPPAIRRTAQFSGLCPASAVMMRKRLAS